MTFENLNFSGGFGKMQRRGEVASGDTPDLANGLVRVLSETGESRRVKSEVRETERGSGGGSGSAMDPGKREDLY